ncbi:MAG TPA: sugar ABC transporter ATP-binding protein [Candidatus Angelobacter sp.]|nr:sugar ABC transporter ATP-binding protein [Candidatus Angelobacter sp.]
MATDPQALLEIRGLTKSFPGVKALQGVDFTVRRGEVHALMGENGAGKSTLIKVLTGVYPRDSGTVRLDGTEIRPDSPKAAEAVGISTVYQEVNLIPHLSVAENICLGRQPTRLGMIRWRAMARRAEAAMARLGLRVDVTRPLSSCSIAIQQMVAIARALDVSAKLLILDEPTSSLDENEVEELFSVIRKLRGEGLGVVIVTHFLDQVYAISDRITVLRDGGLVGEYETARLPRMELVSRMIGKELSQVPPTQSGDVAGKSSTREPFVELKQCGRRGSIAPMDLSIGKGEIVGLAGLLGSGRTETARLIFGIDKIQTGEMRVEGKPAEYRSPSEAIRAGFAFTPENRKSDGIIPHLSIRENIMLALQARHGVAKAISRKQQDEIVEKFIQLLGISTPGPEQLVMNLSGGNQQKVLLARWLATQPRLLILDEPTRGIDVGAKAEILKLMQSLGRDGMSILFISSELEEVVRYSERVVVLRDRAKVGELAGAQINEEAIMHTIAGGASE